MKILIDTHILLFSLDNKDALTNTQQLALLNKENQIYVSQFSLMEIVIKLKIGKLVTINTTIEDFINYIIGNGFILLPIQNEHLQSYLDTILFENHRDPFDRFIIATAKFEGMSLMTNDSKFTQYQTFVPLWK